MLRPNLPFFNDREGAKVPAGLPDIVDAHVHIFPKAFFQRFGSGLTRMHGTLDTN